MERPKKLLIVISIFLFVLLVATTLLSNEHYLILSLVIMFVTFMPFMIRFSKKKLTSRELVLLAILGSIAAISRVPFASLPSVQPTTFVIIVAAIALGPQSGFVIGGLAAIVSNLFLGQGPWTPWQMYSWGMIGLVAGLLQHTWIMRTGLGRIIYGFIVGFLFGWIMNLWFIIGVIQETTWQSFLLYYSASFYFDLAHALSNVFFLLLFGPAWIKIIERFKRKYGLFE
ncbi:ECF transporter S component [Virgibacillus sp. SK37]|uniref:ECF transporter S component n=1 Tax=Virgibacillus sp. SK37 TaxID=403957 RepID=UPI0004D18C51|nr:ECF transporter S component [Virgibacillus sp. SK37]AIF44282.1 membrane protein [Virgibacillus sp. SK37]